MSDDTLARDLVRLDGRPYGHYRGLRGRSYPLGPCTLRFDHVQGDPFAAPSRLRIDVPSRGAGAPCLGPPRPRRAPRHRRLPAAGAAHGAGPGRGRFAGSGRSGLLEISPAGQEVLERTGAAVDAGGGARVRLCAGLARGGPPHPRQGGRRPFGRAPALRAPRRGRQPRLRSAALPRPAQSRTRPPCARSWASAD